MIIRSEIEYKRVNSVRSNFERKFAILFRAVLNKQFKAVAAKINETNYTEPPISIIKEDDIRKMFVALYSAVGSHFAASTYRTTKAQADEEIVDKWQQYLMDYATTQAGSRIVSITKMTKEQIKKLVAENVAMQVEQGWGAEETARNIRKAVIGGGEEMNRWRSLRIARTEVMTSSNIGSLLGARDLGVPMEKIWVATMDQRTRDSHAIMNGVAVDINEPFEVSGIPMECPGDPDGLPEDVINCRCTLAYRVKR